MHVAINSIIRKSTRKDNEKLNIITFPTHERYQSNMADVNANFWMITSEKIKKWNEIYAEMPKNHFLLNTNDDFLNLPKDISFDAVLSQSKYGQYDIAKKISKHFHIPLICLEHTAYIEKENEILDKNNINKGRFFGLTNWCEINREKIGNVNIFISEYSVNSWKFKGKPIIIKHGIDTKKFTNQNLKRKENVLSIVNDWKNRDAECGYYLWLDITKNIETKVLGDNPGLSDPAKDIDELVSYYNQSLIFLNTAIFSPIPTVLLEAMSCGCCVISTKCGMVDQIIKNGENGFISNDKEELKKYINLCLNNKDLCKKMGENARKTIVNEFNLESFVSNWNKALQYSANKNWWNYEG